MAGDDPKPSDPENKKDDETNFNDPFEGLGQFTDEDLHNFMSDNQPELMDLSITQNPLPLPPPPPPPPPTMTQSMEITETLFSQELSLFTSDLDTTDDFLGFSFDDDPTFSWDMLDIPTDDLNNNNNNVQEENVGNNNVGEITRLEVITPVFGDNNGPNFEIGGPSTRPVPVTPPISDGIFLCTCCNQIRQLVHTNGGEMRRLDIHGGNGFYCHAVLEIHRVQNPNEPEHRTYHFKGLRIEDVNKFIEDFCSWQQAGGFALVHDSNTDFYTTTTASSFSSQLFPPLVDDPMSLVMPTESFGVPPVPHYVGLREEVPKQKKKVRQRRQTPLAAQRERTGKLTVKDMSMHFHLPMAEAARKMGLCPTVIKKVCRRGGVYRWPYRKINSLESRISSLKSVLRTAKDADVRARAEAEIERLQQKINEICSDALKNLQ